MQSSWRLHRTLRAAFLSLLVVPSILVGAPAAPAVAADASAAGPIMRLTPVRPPHGQPPYPHGTRIEGQKVILPHGDVHLWLELQIENWASLGSLRSYAGAIVPYWPWPCPPFCIGLSARKCTQSDSCTAAGLPQCSTCENALCTNACIMTERSDFVFEGRRAETRVHTVGCSARFAAWLPDGEHGVTDSGGVAYAGTWVVDVGGEVPNGTYELSFIPGTGQTFLVGDAAHGKVLPVTYGATIQLGEPAIYTWLKFGLAAVVGLLLGASVGYGLWRRSRRSGTDRPA